MKIRIRKITQTILTALFFVCIFNLNTSAQDDAWTPNTSTTGSTSHYGYVYSGSTSYNGKFQAYGSSWTNGFHFVHRYNSDANGRWLMGYDGMLFKNYDPTPNYNTSFSFRNHNDDKLFTIYNDASLNIGTLLYTSMPSGTKVRVIDANYPSLMVAKSSTVTGDISIASGDGFYSNISLTDDFIIRASSGNLVLTSRTTDGDIKFATGFGDSEKMIITQAGNVGIGTSTPSNELEVNGTIRTKEVKVEATGWPDFVFSSDYNLMSLDNVEKYINENGHLPNLENAETVEKNGVNVGEMQAKLLQKIEELTLYMIDLRKENLELNERINELVQK